MSFYLTFFFDTYLDPTHLKPRQKFDGSVDHYDLGYVENVVAMQVLAELRTLEPEQESDVPPEYICQDIAGVLGKNVAFNPENPLQVVAKVNGYPVFSKGKISVRQILEVQGDVDFHTGNILFVGDLVIQENVLDGFSIQARNILVKQHICGATVQAQRSIVAEAGVKGRGDAFIKAGKSIRLPFCENATLVAQDNILINGSCMHSELYVGKQLAVRGRLLGGAVYCHENIYVEEQLGGGMATETKLKVGYDPFSLLKIEEIERDFAKIEIFYQRIQARAGEKSLSQEVKAKIELIERKMAVYEKQLKKLWENIYQNDKSSISSIVVPGTIRPGVDIHIGEANLYVEEKLENVRVSRTGSEITINSPAIVKK